MRLALLALVGALLVLLAACELRLAVDVEVGHGGDGTFEIAVALDPELQRILEDAGVDVLASLDDLRAAVPGWDVASRDDEDGVEVRFSAAFANAAEFNRLADDFHALLDEEDPHLFEALRLEEQIDGTIAFTGRVGLLLPATPGVAGEGVAIDVDAVERLLDEHGDDVVAYDLRVTLPSVPLEHDADVVDDHSLIWHAPVGEMRDVSAVSDAPGWAPLHSAVVGGLVAAVVGFLGVLLYRRARVRARG